MDKRAVKSALVCVLATLLGVAIIFGGIAFLIWMCLDATRATILCVILCVGAICGLFHYYYSEAMKEIKRNEDFDKKQTDVLIQIVEKQLQLGMNVDFTYSTGEVRIYNTDGDTEKDYTYECPNDYKDYFMDRMDRFELRKIRVV
jgi:hypothetical protein